MTTWTDRVIEGGALFLLVFTPLAFGTVQPWSEAVAALVILLMALLYVVGGLRNWELRVELPPGWLAGLAFLALVATQVAGGLSVDPHTTRREALKLLAVAAFYLVCWNVYRTRRQAHRALWAMIATGTLLALLGIVQRATWNGHLYWIGPEIEGGRPFGPYVNSTHFAGLMISVVPLALAFMLAGERRERRRRWRVTWGDRVREWAAREGSARSLVPALALVMGGAALASGSRGGVLALAAALSAMLLGALAGGRSWSGRAARLALVLLLIGLTALWTGGEVLSGTVERLAEEMGRPDESVRARLWTDALNLWSTAPVIGTGLGTFGVAFPRFRTIEGAGTFTHAESDWVQLLTDTGLLGLGLALAALASVAVALVRRLHRAPTRGSRLFALAGLVALGGAAVQGIGNYNLTVMSNFLYLALAVVLAARAHNASERPAPAGGASQ